MLGTEAGLRAARTNIDNVDGPSRQSGKPHRLTDDGPTSGIGGPVDL